MRLEVRANSNGTIPIGDRELQVLVTNLYDEVRWRWVNVRDIRILRKRLGVLIEAFQPISLIAKVVSNRDTVRINNLGVNVAIQPGICNSLSNAPGAFEV